MIEKDGTPTSKTFEHLASEIGAEEAEEVGVEHLLRDVKDTTVGTLSQRITAQLLGLKGLLKQVRHIHEYLDQVYETFSISHCTMNSVIYRFFNRWFKENFQLTML
jgi:26S proteasome regulatory subunit N8